nr:endonuclease NucS domain-containing protein [Deinococcus apachensis]
MLARQPELIEPGLKVLDRELLVESGGIDLYAQDAQGALWSWSSSGGKRPRMRSRNSHGTCSPCSGSWE